MNRPNFWSEQKEILFEDNHLLIINKPAGVLVQGDATGDEPLIGEGRRVPAVQVQEARAAFVA